MIIYIFVNIHFFTKSSKVFFKLQRSVIALALSVAQCESICVDYECIYKCYLPSLSDATSTSLYFGVDKESHTNLSYNQVYTSIVRSSVSKKLIDEK